MIKLLTINFKKYWFLIRQLMSRDFKVKYKRSVLGVLWSLLNPILMMAVMAVVFSQMFKFKVDGINYLVYLMTGIIIFNYFSQASHAGMTSVVENFPLINKIYIPKYVFPFAKCLSIGIDFLLTLIPWLGIIALSYFGLGEYTCHFNIYFLFLPYIFFCILLFTIGISLLLSCVSVFLRDIFHIYGILITLWNYLTPVFYSVEILPKKLQFIMNFNPLYQFIDAVRTIVLYGKMPTIESILCITAFAVGMLLIGSAVFRSKQDKFIYYI